MNGVVSAKPKGSLDLLGGIYRTTLGLLLSKVLKKGKKLKEKVKRRVLSLKVSQLAPDPLDLLKKALCSLIV